MKFRANQLQRLISQNTRDSCGVVREVPYQQSTWFTLRLVGLCSFKESCTSTRATSMQALLVTSSEFIQREGSSRLRWALLQGRQGTLRCFRVMVSYSALQAAFLPQGQCAPGNAKLVSGTFPLPEQTIIKSHLLLDLQIHTGQSCQRHNPVTFPGDRMPSWVTGWLVTVAQYLSCHSDSLKVSVIRSFK